MSKLRHAKIPPNLLQPASLKDEVVLEASLGTLEGFIMDLGINREVLLRDVAEASPNLLGFALSAIDDVTAAHVAVYMQETFPTAPGRYDASLALSVLQNLVHFFNSIQHLPSTMVDCQRAVELAPPVLTAIATLEFPSDHPNDDRATGKRSNGRSRRPSQREQKKTIRPRGLSTVNSAPFAAIGKDVPQTQEEATELYQAILRDQQEILQFFLATLRRPKTKETFKNAYIPPGIIVDDASASSVSESSTFGRGSETSRGTSAYPNVMPLKAALYFDSADGFGAWTIWMSQKACKDLRSINRRNVKLFRIIVNKIKDLSHGHFSEDNQKHLAGRETNIPIFEAKMTRDTRLIYQVDCLEDFDMEIETQVLRIFGIYTHAEIDGRLWDAVSHKYTNDDREYRRRCVFRNKTSHPDNVILPATFPPTQEPVAQLNEIAALPKLSDEMNEEIHSIVNLEHYVNLDQDLMHSIEADFEVSHVFNLSPEEQKIVRHNGSCFVIGRSGTGKTTTALYKMYRIELRWKTLNEHSGSKKTPRPRQIFVTRSRVLSEKVQEQYEGLLRSRESGYHGAKSTPNYRSLQDILDAGDEDHWQVDLPCRFSQLSDENFPLFLSSDRLLGLLEADGIEFLGTKRFYSQDTDDLLDADLSSREFARSRRHHLVTYEKFQIAYWPHLPQQLTRLFDPALTFSEIMGVIKGSEQTRDSDSGCLSREEYIHMSRRTQAMFSQQREAVYDLFEAYTRLKKSRRDHDAADRSHSIARFLRTSRVAMPAIHHLYVDEVQDNSMIDAYIFRLICRNPQGFFWGGDTAQTISAGSSFRFDDLKAFMHNIETSISNERVKATPPRLFQLTRNYRSHGGIANPARTIVKMITEFWEYSIDKLRDEEGFVDGPKPLLFMGWDLDDLPFEQFLFGAATDRIQLGADQCILVRDEAALERFQTHVGKIGTVMTLYESKGLEFDDVLIYDFFEDSLCNKSQWRVLLNHLPESLGIKCPTFDENVHNGICLELRFLYVAITRARKHLWVADRSQAAEIMKIIWESYGQVEINPSASGISVFTTSSSAEEWLVRADKLFKNKNYMQAMNAYENAQDFRMRNIAEAHYLRTKAVHQTAKGAKASELAKLYTTAALAFWKSAEEVSDEVDARAKLFRLSAECYEDAKEDKLAAIAYERAGDYSLSASYYRKAEEFDDAVRIVKTCEVDPETAEGIIDIAKLYYLTNDQYQKTFVLFDSDDDKVLEFLDEYGFDSAKVQLLETRSRYAEAAETYAANGLFCKAANMCLLDEPSPSRDRRATDHLLVALSSIFTLGASSLANSETQELLQLVTKLDTTVLDTFQRNQLDMFRSIYDGDKVRLQLLGRSFWSDGRHSASLLCFDHVFSTRPDFNTMTLAEVTTALEDFLLYAEALQKLGGEEDPIAHKDIRELLAFKESQTGESGQYFIPAGSLLYSEAAKYSYHRLNTSNDGFELRAQDLSSFIKLILKWRLGARVRELALLSIIRPERPCLRFSLCTCTLGYLHVNDVATYTSRVIVALLKIRIYHTIWGIEPYRLRRRPHSVLLSCLYEAIMPPSSRFGSYHNLDMSKISDKARRVVLQWVGESMYALKLDMRDPEPHRYFFTVTFQLFFLYQWATGCVIAPPYLRKVPWAVMTEGPRWLMLGETQTYVVPGILDFTAVQGTVGLSRAVSLIRHIIDKNVPIDVTVLNDVLGRICALSTIAYFLQMPSNKGVTLLRSWVQHAAEVGAKKLRSQRVGSLLQLIQLVKYLLEKLISGPDADTGYILYGDRPCRRQNGPLFQAFIDRLCQILVILGLNSSVSSVKQLCFSTIQKADVRGDTIDIQYRVAHTWVNMAMVVRDRLSPSSLDALITIYRKNVPIQPAVPDVKCIKITDLFPAAFDGIIHDSEDPFTQPGPDTSHVFNEYKSLENPDDELQRDSVKPDSVVNQPTDADDDLPVESTTNSLPLVELTETSLFSPEELAAARTIWRFYQMYCRKRRPMKNTMVILRSQVYIACTDASHHVPGQRYRHLYLGAFPHLYACLQSLYAHARKEVKAARKKFTTIDHTQLEEVKDKINQASALVKRVEQLLKTLHPSSELHKKGNVASLRAFAREVDELILKVPKAISGEWQADMLLAKAGISSDLDTLKLTATSKPRLNAEDIDTVL